MKLFIIRLLLPACVLLLPGISGAQSDWPKVITATDGTIINIYQPQTESFASNRLKSRFALSVTEKGNQDPVFGVFWSIATVQTDRDARQVAIESIKVANLKIPADTNPARLSFIKTTLETYMPKVVGQLSLDEVLASLDEDQEEKKLSKDISNQLPKVIYSDLQSMLVLIDGTPQLKKNEDWGLDVVINSPFTILSNKDGKFYLYGGGHWYVSPSAVGPYVYTNDKVQHRLKKIARKLNKIARKNNDVPSDETTGKPVCNIIVSTVPAELIQSDGNPDLLPIEGTALLYVRNSNNDIFVDTHTQNYYVLLSGRWYTSKALNDNSPWQYVASDKLPADFANIPEGSPKDNVLASIAGTSAAKEAVMDAQIPQTAKIDRRTATTHVEFDGSPRFKFIEGTNLQYAVNTSSTVLLSNGRYYAVDNGIWFVAGSPSGPWSVSTDRPNDVDQIPPASPVYNAKYVYVYDVTPDYAYMGYTPGYLNSYVYGPTVVYGTGYDYSSWVGDYYYPRPWT